MIKYPFIDLLRDRWPGGLQPQLEELTQFASKLVEISTPEQLREFTSVFDVAMLSQICGDLRVLKVPRA